MWSDQRIGAGADWRREIGDAIERARVALFLVSVHSLNSPFILDEEIPRLLDRRRTEGMVFIPVIVSPCPWTRVPWLVSLLARPRDGHPLSGFSDHEANAALSQLAMEIGDLLIAQLPSPAAPNLLPGAARFTGAAINIDFKDGDLQEIFRLFADISGLNIVLLPGVQGARITLKLIDVAWDHAFHLIVRAHGWDYDVEGNVVTIGRQADLKRLR